MGSQRRDYILRLLAERGSLRNATLARELQVTDETIRTDFIALEKMGYLRRCHGGAIYCIPSQHGDQHPASQLLLPLVEHIERVHAQQQDALLYIDHSPLGMLLLKLLEQKPLRLISNSPSLLYMLQAPSHPHGIISTGGELDKDSALLLGAAAIRSLEENPPHCAILSPQHLQVTSEGAVRLNYAHPQASRWAEAVARRSQQLHIIGQAAMFSSSRASLTSPEQAVQLNPSSISGIYSEQSEESLQIESLGLDIPLYLAPLVEAPRYDEEEY